MINLPCPQCGASTTKHGKTSSGSQRYRCKACKITITNSGRSAGRPLIGDEPMSGSELYQRWLESDPDAREKRRRQQKRRRAKKN